MQYFPQEVYSDIRRQLVRLFDRTVVLPGESTTFSKPVFNVVKSIQHLNATTLKLNTNINPHTDHRKTNERKK